MLLHKDKNLFERTIFQVAQRSGIESGIIEKDYYVSLLLKELSQTLPSMIFKGGTSLSKCHKVIKRFSEDIDITLDENHLSQGNRKSVKTEIVNACEKLGFSISNLDDIKSGMDFNHYKIEYSGLFMIDGLKPDIEIDTIFSIRSFPYEQKMATSIIYDYLHEMGLDEFIDTYFVNNDQGKTIGHFAAAKTYPMAAQDVKSGNAFAMPAELPVIEAMTNLGDLSVLYCDYSFLSAEDKNGLTVSIGTKKGNDGFTAELNGALEKLTEELRAQYMGEAATRSAANA